MHFMIILLIIFRDFDNQYFIMLIIFRDMVHNVLSALEKACASECPHLEAVLFGSHCK